jgi:general stress protein YciG
MELILISGEKMAGTKEGGVKAAETNKARHGKDFYKNIGGKGGKAVGVKKGFAANPDLARKAGKKGGKISKRVKK